MEIKTLTFEDIQHNLLENEWENPESKSNENSTQNA